MFLWRALSGALAVAECLCSHGMNVPLICPVCKNDAESISHVLFECSMASQVWRTARVPALNGRLRNSLEDYIEHLFGIIEAGPLCGNYRQAIPWIIWCIWKQRNEKVYAATDNIVDILIAQALEDVEEWRKLNEEDHQEMMRDCRVRDESMASKEDEAMQSKDDNEDQRKQLEPEQQGHEDLHISPGSITRSKQVKLQTTLQHLLNTIQGSLVCANPTTLVVIQAT
ncbi:hypothetical protein V5N11_027776 [Cardamine amara subsp. amara]|uniref:Reverse transcriptase zinc-binding domain-containing protein n=1 Tax=Cardamine amara subsp. amara TaxID=228776 RepID=A0ABD1ALG3_CARAN